MNGQLTIFLPGRPARRLFLDGGRRYVIGRDPACDISLPDERISRRHAECFGQDGEWYCRDLGSKNGIRVDGNIAECEKLPNDGWIDLGGLLANFRQVDAEQLAEQARQTTRKRETSLRLSRQIDPSRELPALLDDILASIIELADTERAFLMLENEAGDFEIVASRGLSRRDVESREFSGSLGIVRETLARRRSIVSCDIGGFTRFADRPSVVDAAIRAVACLPVTVREEQRGVIYTDSKSPGKVFDELDLYILEGFAERSAVALALALVRESLDSVAVGMHSGGWDTDKDSPTPMTLDGLLSFRDETNATNNDRPGEQTYP